MNNSDYNFRYSNINNTNIKCNKATQITLMIIIVMTVIAILVTRMVTLPLSQ